MTNKKAINQNVKDTFPNARYEEMEVGGDVIHLTKKLWIVCDEEYYILYKKEGLINHFLAAELTVDAIVRQAEEIIMMSNSLN